MPSMSYCRHENTLTEMQQTWDAWEDYADGTSTYEDRSRAGIICLVREMHEQFEFDGSYDSVIA